jgi:hypothetical protein
VLVVRLDAAAPHVSSSAASESPTWVGEGVAPSIWSRSVPRSARGGVEAGPLGAEHVGVEPVAEGEDLALAERSRAASYMAGSGFPAIASALRPVAVSTAARTAPEPGHWPSGIGNVRVAAEPDQLGAAQHRLGGDAQLAVVEALVVGDHDDVGAGRELGVLTIRRPASATWSTIACEPIT